MNLSPSDSPREVSDLIACLNVFDMLLLCELVETEGELYTTRELAGIYAVVVNNLKGLQQKIGLENIRRFALLTKFVAANRQ